MTNPIFWKEWRENRLIAVWAAAITLGLLIGLSVVMLHSDYFGEVRRIDISVLDGATLLVWIGAAIVCGSSMFAPEIGSGSLMFLSALPISRREIWWTKIASGVLMLILCMLASAATYLAIGALEHTFGVYSRSESESLQMFVLTFPIYFAFCGLPLFAVGSVVTMLTDRTISALMACLLASIAIATGMYALAGWLDIKSEQIDYGLLGLAALSIPILLSMSYSVFTRGETLKTSKRFKALIPPFFVPILVIGAALIISYLIIVW